MVNKSKFRIVGIILAIVLAVVLLANILFNFYLKKEVPRLVSENTDYNVKYRSLNVDLLSGRIKASQVNIQTKNPSNPNVLRVNGFVDSVVISRIGLVDALVHKDLNAADIILHNASLELRLNKPVEEQKGKKRKPANFSKISVYNSDIKVLRPDETDLVSMEQLNLEIYNLQLSEEDVEDKLPIAFDRYTITGSNFSYLTDNKYRIKIDKVESTPKNMVLTNFILKSELSLAQFRKDYPHTPNYFSLNIPKFEFKNLLLKGKRIALENVQLSTPKLDVFSTGGQNNNKSPMLFELNLENLEVSDAQVNVFTAKGQRLASAGSLNVAITKLKMDSISQRGTLPFTYKGFTIKAKKLSYATADNLLNASDLNFTPKELLIKDVALRSRTSTGTNLEAKTVKATYDHFLRDNRKLDLAGKKLLVTGLTGRYREKKQSSTSVKPSPLPISFAQVNIEAPKIVLLSSKGRELHFSNIHASGTNLDFRDIPTTSIVPFKITSPLLRISQFNYKINNVYRLFAGPIRIDNSNLSVLDFQIAPLVSRSAFVSSLPKEKDLYQLKIEQFSVEGINDIWQNKAHWNISNVGIVGMDASIFRSKIPPDDTTLKPMYSELLRSVKQPFTLRELKIKKSRLVYEEDTKKSEGPGKLIFSDFSLDASNLNTNKNTANHLIPIEITARFMGVSPIDINWSLDTSSPVDQFKIRGNIWSLPASALNSFVEPYLNIQTTGQINHINFNYSGNKNSLDGEFAMKHSNLKVNILKQDGEKDKLLSAAANLIVRSNSGKFPDRVNVDNVMRDKSKSFFNFFWLAIQEGLKKTLIGSNVEQTETRIENTVNKGKGLIHTKDSPRKSN